MKRSIGKPERGSRKTITRAWACVIALTLFLVTTTALWGTPGLRSVLADESIPIDESSFPDAAFRQCVLEACDQDGNGALDAAEQTAVRELVVSAKGIQSLVGIERFPSLIKLVCDGNSLTALNTQGNPALRYLFCHNNSLAALNVSGNADLALLTCYGNQLTELDVTQCASLVGLYCGNNLLSALDVTQNALLENLSCYKNKLETLDLTRNTALNDLSCGRNRLTRLDVSHNAALIKLACDGNALTSLDLSQNTALTNVSCANNRCGIDFISGAFELSALPGFNSAQASQWAGAAYDAETNQLTGVQMGAEITYAYDCGFRGLAETFALIPERDLGLTASLADDRENADAIAIGKTVTWTVTGAGGAEPYACRLTILKDSEPVYTGAFEESGALSFTFMSEGEFTAVIDVKDAAGALAQARSALIKVENTLLASITRTSGDAHTAKTGETAVWTAAAKGGTAPYAYRFDLSKNGELYLCGEYGTASELSFAFTEPGIYQAVVYVKDALGTELSAQSAMITVTQALSASLFSTLDGMHTSPVGKDVAWVVIGTGGTTPYAYRIEILKDGEPYSADEYGDAYTQTLTLTDLGVYQVIASVRDAEGEIATVKGPTIKVESDLSVSVSGTLSIAASADENPSITWVAAAKDGTPPYQYRFVLHHNDQQLDTGEYSGSSAYTITCTDEGTYSVTAYALDANDHEAAAQSVGISAVRPVSATVTSTLDDTLESRVGQSVTWTALGESGYTPYTYKLDVYKNGILYSSGTYGDKNTLTLQFSSYGKYTVKAYIKDVHGLVAEAESQQINVKKYMSVIIPEGPLTAETGDRYTWRVMEYGGKPPYQYRIDLYLNGQMIIEDTYSNLNSRTYQFNQPGVYHVVVYVKDRTEIYVRAKSKQVKVEDSLTESDP